MPSRSTAKKDIRRSGFHSHGYASGILPPEWAAIKAVSVRPAFVRGKRGAQLLDDLVSLARICVGQSRTKRRMHRADKLDRIATEKQSAASKPR
jgi:hypothetical protein